MKNRELIPLSDYESPFVQDMDPEKELFCYQYALDLNPQLAAERCGITTRMARKWLKEEMVQKAVSDIKSKVIAQCELDVKDVVNAIKRHAFFDIKELYKGLDKDGNPVLRDLDEIDGRAIAEISFKETKTGKILPVIKAQNALQAQKILLDYATGANNNTTNVQVNINQIKNSDPETAMSCYTEVVRGATLENNKEDDRED